MPEQQTADLGALVNTLESNGSRARFRRPGQTWQEQLAKLFGVDMDEVAILKLVPKYKSLKFVIPEKLSPVGTIPLTSTTALAARTARERKAGSGQ